MKITVVGSTNIDMCSRVPSLPAPGETVGGGSFMQAYGGKGANQAVAAKRLGAEVCFISALGDDRLGDELLEYFKAQGLDVSAMVRAEGLHTGIALIMIDPRGENCIAVNPGANAALTPAHIDAARESIASADVLVMQAEVPYETVKHAARIARASGTRVLYNPAPALRVDDEMLAMTDLLVVNRGESTAISGLDGLEESAEALCRRGAAAVVVTLGADGAYYRDGSGTTLRVPAYKVKSVDAVGAGDTFCGALAVKYAATGRVDTDALMYATAAAALSVTREGAQPSIPTAAETIDFINRR